MSPWVNQVTVDVRRNNGAATDRSRTELAGAGAPSSWERQQLTDGLGAALRMAAYMSPEQALGRPVDARSDLFSSGILLYEMCTGRSPFQGDTTGELLIAIVQQVQVTPAQLNPGVPDGLGAHYRSMPGKGPGFPVPARMGDHGLRLGTHPATPEVSHYTQLTHDGEAKFLAGTDGARLYKR